MESSNTPDTGQGHRVVFQYVAADQASQKALVSNLRNLLNVWPDAEIEVVVHGPGISLLHTAGSVVTDQLTALLQTANLRVVVCENTLKGHQLTLSALMPGIGTVPVAIIELILKQEQGWAYLKAGL